MEEKLEITPHVIKEIFKTAISSRFYEDETGVSIDNFTTMYQGVAKKGMDIVDLLKGTSDHTKKLFYLNSGECEINERLKDFFERTIDQFSGSGLRKKPFSKDDRYISKEDNNIIFKNVIQFLKNESENYSPKQFRNIAKEGIVGMDKIKLSLLPLLSGRNVEDTANVSIMVSGDRNKYRMLAPINPNEDISVYYHRDHGILEKTDYKVKALRGYNTLEEQMWWFLGNCEVALEASQEKVLCDLTQSEFDQTTGNFKFGIYSTPKRFSKSEISSIKKNFTDIGEGDGLKFVRKGKAHSPSKLEEKLGGFHILRKVAKKKALKRFKDVSQLNEIRNSKVDAFHNREYESIMTMKDYCSDTAFHQKRGIITGSLFGRQLGLPESTIREIVLGYLVHDRGKILVPESILQYEGTYDEYQKIIMELHALLGGFKLAIDTKMSIDIDDPIKRKMREYEAVKYIKMATEHQEKADGSGYPFGVDWKQTSIAGSISQIIDVFDAVYFPRVYNKKGRNLHGDGGVYDILFNKAKDSFQKDLLNFFKEVTFPTLESLSYGPNATKFDFLGKEMTSKTQELVGYCIGNNTTFDPRNYDSPDLNQYLKNHVGIDYSLDSYLLDVRSKLYVKLNELSNHLPADLYSLVTKKLSHVKSLMKDSTSEFVEHFGIDPTNFKNDLENRLGGELVFYND